MEQPPRIPNTQALLLNRYRIDAMLGEGGLGTVYKAYDTRLKRTVAIKTLKRSVYVDDVEMFRTLEERFQREAEAGSRMHIHPNLVVVHDFLRDSDMSLYLVQEFVPGGTLADRLAREIVLSQPDALRLTREVALGLAAANAMHIVHRDIKPANIFLSADGRAKVGDFGIAQLDDLSGRTRTTAGHPGTPLYMSPEQGGSSGYVRAESDQYSLGLVLFEMLTGQTYKQLRKRHAEELLSQQPPQIQMLVRRMIAEDPDERYESTMDVATDISKIERQLTSAAIFPPQFPRTEQRAQRFIPPVNLQPIRAAQWQSPPAIPLPKAKSRRNIIFVSSVLALMVCSFAVFEVLHVNAVVAPTMATPKATVGAGATSTVSTTSSLLPTAELPIPTAPEKLTPTVMLLTATAASNALATLPTASPFMPTVPTAATAVVQQPARTTMPTATKTQGAVLISDPFDYCAQVGTADFSDRHQGQIQYSGSEGYNMPFAHKDNSYNIEWRCSSGYVLGCQSPTNVGIRKMRITCGTIDTSREPPASAIQACTGNSGTFVSDYGQSYSAYHWACSNGKPVIDSQVIFPDQLDDRGYVKENWYLISR